MHSSQEERRISTSVGYGVALYPTAGISLKANLLLKPPPVAPSARANPIPLGAAHQAELPDLMPSCGSIDRGDVLVTDPTRESAQKSVASQQADARELAELLDTRARQAEKMRARAMKKEGKAMAREGGRGNSRPRTLTTASA